MSWTACTLNDVCDKAKGHIQTGPFGSQLHQSDYSVEGTPVVMPKDIVNGAVSEDGIARVEEQHVLRLSRHQVKIGDILFSRRGAVGCCAYISKKEEGWLCGTGCLRVTVDTDIADSKFVFYFLQQSSSIDWIEKHAIGATMLNLNTGILASVPLMLPDLPTQHRIASILSSYDDLIENNRRQIKLLEEAAQRLYREWFVELRFPGHEGVKVVDGVPEGWKKGTADEFFHITIGKTPPRAEKQWFLPTGTGIPWASISDMGNADTFLFNTSECLTQEATEKFNVKIVPAGTILVSFKLTVGRVVIANNDMCTNEAIAHFYIDDESVRAYAFSYLKNYEYDSLGSTSSISKAVNSKIIKAMSIIMPDSEIIKAFAEIQEPILKAIQIKQASIIRLIEARDRLLPKLMSGEMEL